MKLLTIEQVADKLTRLYLKCSPEESDCYEIIKYGNENIISSACNFAVVTLAGLVAGDAIGAWVFFLCFAVLRSWMGGYHADTYFKCNLLIFMNVVLVVRTAALLNDKINVRIIIIIMGLALLEIIFFAPLMNENKKIRIYSKKRIKVYSIIVLSALGILAYVMYKIGLCRLSCCVLLSIFSTCVAFLFEGFRKTIKQKMNI